MYIADSFIDSGKVYAACSGPGINSRMSIKRIKVDGNEYNVSALRVVNSFIGVPQVVLELSGLALPPTGEVTVLE